MAGRGRAGVDWLGIIGWRFGVVCAGGFGWLLERGRFLVWERLARFVLAWSWCAYSAHDCCPLVGEFSGGWCGRG